MEFCNNAANGFLVALVKVDATRRMGRVDLAKPSCAPVGRVISVRLQSVEH